MLPKQIEGFKVSLSQQQILWQHLCATSTVDMNAWTRLAFNGRHLGWLNTWWRGRLLADWPGVVTVLNDTLDLRQPDWHLLGEMLQQVAEHWRQRGWLNAWRGEFFDVCDLGGNVLFCLERAACRPLGLCSHAVHINGWTTSFSGERWWWIARRSLSKAVDPNMLDTLVGGGVSSGESVHVAMCREGFEEAGLPASRLQTLMPQGSQYSIRATESGLHREWLHVFDVHLPIDFRPQNQDGEVAAFGLLGTAEMVALMSAGQFTHDALLATTDSMWRGGYFNADQPLAQWLSRPRG